MFHFWNVGEFDKEVFQGLAFNGSPYLKNYVKLIKFYFPFYHSSRCVRFLEYLFGWEIC